MFKRYGSLILFVGMVWLFSAGMSRAWMVGEFQIPVQKVRPQPVVSRPAAAASSSSSRVAVSPVESRAGQSFTDSVTGMEFVWVPGGCLQMGSLSGESKRGDDEGPVHKVCVDGFWMAKYEVTQGQWQKIMGSNPSNFPKGWFKKDDNYPVEQVSWDDCQEFVKKLNRRGNKTFRLPTEAEWEYACRAGTKTLFSFGNTISTDQANYDGNYTYGNGRKGVYRKSTVKVGSFSPNAFGLYDMHGNVWEWCADWYGKNYYKNSQERNPRGPGSGSNRVNRGGSWYDDPRRVRSAVRDWNRPGNRLDNLGFRLVSPGRQ